MARKDKDGNWTFDSDDEERIAIMTEANIRAHDALEKRKPQPWDGKTERRKADRRKPAPPKKDKSFW